MASQKRITYDTFKSAAVRWVRFHEADTVSLRKTECAPAQLSSPLVCPGWLQQCGLANLLEIPNPLGRTRQGWILRRQFCALDPSAGGRAGCSRDMKHPC
jgi:hypothetical protein